MVSTRSELAGGYDSECGVGGVWPATSERPEKELALRRERAWCVPETGRRPWQQHRDVGGVVEGYKEGRS